jgi:alpha-L-arabinofuranosidase
MTNIGRRHFLGGALAGGLACLAVRGSQGAGARIEVLLDESVGTISPDIYGHFVEHLGGVVYDGVWVGTGSKIPNAGGIRAALVEHMRRIKPPVIRYPGGCFADSYDWRDGVGPRATASTHGLLGRDRDEPVRHQRVRALLPTHGRATLPRREPARPARSELLRVG